MSVDHRRPYPGDNGIRWEPMAGVEFPDWAMNASSSVMARLPVQGLPRNIDVRRIDLSAVAAEWESRLADLLEAWVSVTERQRRQIVDRVRAAITADDLAALAALSVSTAEATEVLTDAMSEMALAAAQGMSAEAAGQGVRIDPVAVDRAVLGAVAGVTAVLLGQGLANAAGREAARRWSPTATGDEVSAAVEEHLRSLSPAFVETNLGGMLTVAQNAGRRATALAGPTAAIYASEMMDINTCQPCRSINGKWIGNSDDPDITAKIEAVYPNGGYVECEGGRRCRGTTVAIYRPRTVAGA